MKFSEYDIVVLMCDRLKDGLKKGDKGTIVIVHDHPKKSYEVEFVDENGRTRTQVVLTQDEMQKYLREAV